MKNVLILVVVAAAVVGFAYFALFSTPANELAGEAEQTAEELSVESMAQSVVSEPKQGKGTLESLRLLNEDLECTIVSEGDQSKVEGTYFVSEGSVRGDFLTPSPDLSGQILSSVIIDNGMMFSWSEIEGEMYGVKLNLATVNEQETRSNEPVSMNSEVDYDCKPWKNVDRTVFVPPATVLFQDTSDLMKAGMEYGTVYEGRGVVVPEMP